MTAQIRPSRLEVSDRFPMLGFNIRSDRPDVQAEVALATDIALFRPENRTLRTAGNFYSSREGGALAVPRGEGVFMVPPEVLERFVGQDKLYFGLATGPSQGDMVIDALPRDGSPYISLRGLTGRSIRRTGIGGRGARRTSGPSFDWAGDAARPGTEPPAPVAAVPANGAPAPAPMAYDDGFGALDMPVRRTPRRAPTARPFARVDMIYAPSNPADAAAALRDFAQRDAAWAAGVPDTGFFPHSAICHLEMTDAAGDMYAGTGFYVAPDLILTVAHNLEGKTGVRIRAGLNGAGGALSDFTAAPSDWTLHPHYVPHHSDYDLAVIRVATPHHGLQFTLHELLVSQPSPVIVCGYGAETVDPLKQHLDGDAVRELSPNGQILRYNLQTEKGNSGSPVFFVDVYEDHAAQQSVADWMLVGVHSAGHDRTLNQACALTAAKIAWVESRGLSSPAPAVAHGLTARAQRAAAGRPGPARMLSTDPLTVDVKYRMFIPSPAIDSPFAVYGGDGRGFSYDAGTSRGEIHAKVRLSPGGAIEDISVVDRHWGESTAYATDDTYHPDGHPDWWREKVDGAQPSERATLGANDANLSIQTGAAGTTRAIMSVNEPSALFSITAAGGLPLSHTAPDIDADIGVFLRINGSSIEAKIEGEHDGFPCHELYINRHLVWSHDPVAAGTDPTSLMPPMDMIARTGWVTVGALSQAQALAASLAADDIEPAVVRPDLPGGERARAQRVGGAFADRIGQALDLGLEPKLLVPMLDLLDPPAPPQPVAMSARGRRKAPPPARPMVAPVLAAAGAIAGIAIEHILGDSGDVSWTLAQWNGIKNPNDQAPPNAPPMKDAPTISLADWPKVERDYGITSDEIWAKFKVDFQYNGRSLGAVRIQNIGSEDAAGLALTVTTSISDDHALYGPNQCAALRVSFHYRFEGEGPEDDDIAVAELHLFGDGTHKLEQRWEQ